MEKTSGYYSFLLYKFVLLVLIRRRIFMEKTRKETGLKRLMFNYIKLLFCAVVSVALFMGVIIMMITSFPESLQKSLKMLTYQIM